MNTIIEKIRAEVIKRIDKRRLSEQAKNELVSLLSFLSDLEKEEKPTTTEGLEEEYKDYVESDPVYSKLVNRNAGLVIARHFAQWGVEHLKK